MVVQEPLETYHQHASQGSSKLKIILESPKLYKAHFIDKKITRKETKALSFGTAIHLALLEPKKFLDRYVVVPKVNKNTNVYKEWREEVLKSDPNTVLMEQADMDNLNGMVESIMSHKDASAMLRKGIPERSIYQDVEIEGGIKVPCKVRPDYLHECGDLIDVKTTVDAGFEKFRRQIYELEYDLSAAFYKHVADLEFGKKSDRYFWWLAIEKTCPWEVCVYRANDMVIDHGTAKWKHALWRYSECMRKNEWPGKQERAQDIDLPPYAKYEEFNPGIEGDAA